MSDKQPARSPSDPGPDWWPRFGWRLAAVWCLQGFLVPLAIYLGVWLVASTIISVSSGDIFSEESVRAGGLFAIGGFFLTGGTIVLTQIFMTGARWSTLFRLAGFTLAMIVQWNLSEVILETF